MFSKQLNFDKLDKDYRFTLRKIQEDQDFTFDFNEFSTGVIPDYITQKQVELILEDRPEKTMFLILSDYGESVEHILEMFGYNINLRCVCFTKSAKYTCIKSLRRYVENPEDFVIFIEGKIDNNQALKDIINDRKMGVIEELICVGNPPYQGTNHQQIYPKIYVWAITHCDEVCMIFPTGWMEAKNANGLKLMNTKEIKKDRQIVSIDICKNVFPNVSGAEYTNIIHWKRGYDNGLNGKQLVYTDGENPKEQEFNISKEDIKKPNEIIRLGIIVSGFPGFKSMEDEVSPRQAYKLHSDFVKNPSKFDMPEIYDEKKSDDDLKIYGIIDKKLAVKYVPQDYPLERKWRGFKKFKVFTGSAWGNMANQYLGGAYSDIILSKPNELSTESFLENGCFDTVDDAKKHAKYILSKFSRALLYIHKHDHHSSRGSWISVPVQDYTEDWWNTDDIDKIDECLFDKYGIPEDIRQFVRENIQPRTINNIMGYNKKSDVEIDLEKSLSECTSEELHMKLPQRYSDRYDEYTKGRDEFLSFKSWLEQEYPELFEDDE